mmetsp:Transcript_27525/g.84969  ORF Transcript_27525/g.84969 Transcript_27525/m.84969 type:complete len:205 (+) Transcript_27525:262-876(+)
MPPGMYISFLLPLREVKTTRPPADVASSGSKSTHTPYAFFPWPSVPESKHRGPSRRVRSGRPVAASRTFAASRGSKTILGADWRTRPDEGADIPIDAGHEVLGRSRAGDHFDCLTLAGHTLCLPIARSDRHGPALVRGLVDARNGRPILQGIESHDLHRGTVDFSERTDAQIIRAGEVFIADAGALRARLAKLDDEHGPRLLIE